MQISTREEIISQWERFLSDIRLHVRRRFYKVKDG